jgi:hypothetical protein
MMKPGVKCFGNPLMNEWAGGAEVPQALFYAFGGARF